MQAEPRFSVIIPTFNRSLLLRAAVRSVLAQSERDLECIVVDDGGIEPLDLPDDARVLLVRHEHNKGKPSALNTGLAVARGTIVAFLDDDDIYLEGRLAAVARQHEDADIVVCNAQWLGEELAARPRELHGDVSDSILDGITPHLDAVSVRREAVLEFDPRYLASQDVEWWIRMADGRSVSTVPNVGCLMRRHSGPRHGNDARARVEFGCRLLEERAEYFRAHPRAKAFRWFRIGLHAARAGERNKALGAMLRSLRTRPSPRVAAHFVRMLVQPSAYRDPTPSDGAAQITATKGAPIFSVIITTFNRPALLREAVESVLRQSEPDLECIVVDDGSTEPLDLPDDPRLQVVRHETNVGGASAFNSGIDAASGALVAFLDDDDLYVEDRLTLVLAEHGSADVVVCEARWLDGGDGRAPRELNGDVSGSILDDITPHTNATSVRRDALLQFDSRYRAAYDVEWWLRMAQSCSVRTVPHLGALIRRHSGVRHQSSADARAQFGRMLLEENSEYFGSHPRAAAFRWFRIGLQAQRAGDRRQARRAFVTSLQIKWRTRVAAHLVRLMVTPPVRGGAATSV